MSEKMTDQKPSSIDRITRFAHPCRYDLRVAPVSFLDNQANHRLLNTPMMKFMTTIANRQRYAYTLGGPKSIQSYYDEEYNLSDAQTASKFGPKIGKVTPNTSFFGPNLGEEFASDKEIMKTKSSFMKTRSLDYLAAEEYKTEFSGTGSQKSNKIFDGPISTSENVIRPEIVVVSSKPQIKNIIYSGTSTIQKTIFLNHDRCLRIHSNRNVYNCEIESSNLSTKTFPRSLISYSKTMPLSNYAMDYGLVQNYDAPYDIDNTDLAAHKSCYFYDMDNSRNRDCALNRGENHSESLIHNEVKDESTYDSEDFKPLGMGKYEAISKNKFKLRSRSSNFENDMKTARFSRDESVQSEKRSISCRPLSRCYLLRCKYCICCLPRRTSSEKSAEKSSECMPEDSIENQENQENRRNDEQTLSEIEDSDMKPIDGASNSDLEISVQNISNFSQELERHTFQLITEYTSAPVITPEKLTFFVPNYIGVSVSAFGYGSHNMWRNDLERVPDIQIQKYRLQDSSILRKKSDEHSSSKRTLSIGSKREKSSSVTESYENSNILSDSLLNSKLTSSRDSTFLEVQEIRQSFTRSNASSDRSISSEYRSHISIRDYSHSMDSLAFSGGMKRIRNEKQFSDKLYRISSELSINTI